MGALALKKRRRLLIKGGSGPSLASLNPMQAIFVSSVPTEDPAVANRWLVPDDRPGTGTGLAIDGAAVQPDGTDDNVIVTGIESTGTSWSFSGWFKSSQAANRYYFDQLSPRCIFSGYYTGLIGLYNQSAWATFGATPNDGAWHYVTFVLDGTTARCFVDGVQSGTDKTIVATSLNAASVQRLFSAHYGSSSFLAGTASQIRIDDIALTLAQHTAAMSGDPADPDYPPNATCLRYWSCEDYHNTLLLDSSSNGGHGTKTGITTGRGAGTFHYKGSDVPLDSLVARRGYTLDGTHGVIPARLTGTLDALGATIAKTGPLKRPGQLKQSYCAKFNGTTGHARVNITPYVAGVSHTAQLWFQPTDVTTRQTLLAATNASGHRIAITVEAGEVRISTVVGVTKSTSASIVVNTMYLLAWEYDSVTNTLTAWLNGVECSGTSSATTRSVTTQTGTVGALNETGSYSYSGIMRGLVVEGGVDCPMTEGIGSTHYDRSGNGNHMTVYNESTGAGGAYWAERQDVLHANLIDGHSRYTHATEPDLLVPYGLDGNPLAITPPAGYSLTRHNPAGAKHNGCETKIDFTGGVAFPGSSGLETAWAFNTVRTSPRFKRNRTTSGSPVAVDRMIALPADATAQQLTDAGTYTADAPA